MKLVKGFPGQPTTAAIGDGANDVSMIQEAHIGLGKNRRRQYVSLRIIILINFTLEFVRHNGKRGPTSGALR